MKKWLFAFTVPLALAGQSVSAEETNGAEEAEMMAALADVFQVEPLTPEQQARLPLATDLIDQIMPDGTMGEMMGSMFDRMLGPIAELAEKSGPKLHDFIGYDGDELELDDAQIAEIAAIVDPNWKERQRRTMALTQTMMGDLMSAMEPSMKRGMSEAYAVHFTRPELEGIQAFFSTEIGATFARKSYKLSSDPRILSAAMREMPTIMLAMTDMDAKLKAEMADLPEKKDFDALGTNERQRISELSGLDEEQLREGMTLLAEQEANGPRF